LEWNWKKPRVGKELDWKKKEEEEDEEVKKETQRRGIKLKWNRVSRSLSNRGELERSTAQNTSK
jgi:hypothetical protein